MSEQNQKDSMSGVTVRPTTTKAEKWKLLDSLGTELDKTYESKTFQRMGNQVGMKIPSIPTNLSSVDRDVFGCGGFPRGRVIEVYGPESSGKTALCLHTIGQCQKAGGVAAFVDAEHALDPTFAHNLGVNMDELVISQPDCGEQALEIVEALVEKQAVDLIVVDSVTALVPRAELDGEMGDSHMGLQARLMSQAMRKLIALTAKKGVTVIFINQVREKVGLVFGNPEVTTGGRALKFFASLRIEVRRVAGTEGLIKEGDKVIGHRMKVKAQKNKVGAPYRETVIELYYDTGFDMADSTIEHAKKLGILEGNAWLTFKSDKKSEKFRREDLTTAAYQIKLNNEIEERYTELQEATNEKNSSS
jgi:recombination protein RecA